MPHNASPISGRLWQGGKPTEGQALRRAGFDTLVLCAVEHQPSSTRFPGVKVVYAPNDDSGNPPTGSELLFARIAADVVVSELRAGKKVLVTCMAGRNRSGLVSGMSLILLGRTSDFAIARIRERREDALTNPWFVKVLHKFAATAPRPWAAERASR